MREPSTRSEDGQSRPEPPEHTEHGMHSVERATAPPPGFAASRAAREPALSMLSPLHRCCKALHNFCKGAKRAPAPGPPCRCEGSSSSNKRSATPRTHARRKLGCVAAGVVESAIEAPPLLSQLVCTQTEVVHASGAPQHAPNERARASLQVSTSAIATGPRPTAEGSTFGTDEPLRIDIGDGPGAPACFVGGTGLERGPHASSSLLQRDARPRSAFSQHHLPAAVLRAIRRRRIPSAMRRLGGLESLLSMVGGGRWCADRACSCHRRRLHEHRPGVAPD